MQNGQDRYFFDVEVGDRLMRDEHGIVLPSADEAAGDAIVIAASMMDDAPQADQAVTVTVRSGGKTVLRVRGLITVERVGQDT